MIKVAGCSHAVGQNDGVLMVRIIEKESFMLIRIFAIFKFQFQLEEFKSTKLQPIFYLHHRSKFRKNTLLIIFCLI